VLKDVYDACNSLTSRRTSSASPIAAASQRIVSLCASQLPHRSASALYALQSILRWLQMYTSILHVTRVTTTCKGWVVAVLVLAADVAQLLLLLLLLLRMV
jgi:NAD(P)H-dependent FMN reductase